MNYNDLATLRPPTRNPDIVDCGTKYWFDEMFMMNQRSDGQHEPCVLGECPLTHQLMYYTGYYPLGWYHVTSKTVQSMYVGWLDELAEEHFTS